jgi:hypothetical protein
VQQTHGRSQLRKYGPDVQHALFLAWHDANRICTKRLMPFLPTLIEALERHEHLHLTEECGSQLLSMSAATADRLLRSQRKVDHHGLSTTRAGTLLKQQIPIRTFKEWEEIRPGFLGCLPTQNGAAATFSASCSASPPNAINRCKYVPFSEACARSEPTFCKPLKSNDKKK